MGIDKAGRVPVEHRWLGLDRRTLTPAAAVAFLILLWAVILPAINNAVHVDRPVTPGTVMTAGRGVSFVPPVGWQIETGLTVEDAGSAPPTPATVTTGASQVRVSTVTWSGTLAGLLQQIREVNAGLNNPAWRITGQPTSTTTDAGVTGVSQPTQSTAGPGELVVFLRHKVGVEIIVSTDFSSLGQDQSAVDDLVASVAFQDQGT